MFRLDAKKGYYFYPDTESAQDSIYWLNSGSTYEKSVKAREDICVLKHGLHIPQNVDSYARFVEQMRLNEEMFLDVLRVKVV